jgi:hypothetical protein
MTAEIALPIRQYDPLQVLSHRIVQIKFIVLEIAMLIGGGGWNADRTRSPAWR